VLGGWVWFVPSVKRKDSGERIKKEKDQDHKRRMTHLEGRKEGDPRGLNCIQCTLAEKEKGGLLKKPQNDDVKKVSAVQPTGCRRLSSRSGRRPGGIGERDITI